MFNGIIKDEVVASSAISGTAYINHVEMVPFVTFCN